jgi:hypothetical protein
MELRDIIQITFRKGKTFYSHVDLEVLITKRYEFNWGRHMNSKIIRSCGLEPIIKKISGRAVRGFMLDITDYTLDQIETIHNSSNEPIQLNYKKSSDEVHKKIRFLIRDWNLLPAYIQIAYKKHKEKYLKEVQLGVAHDNRWFYSIIQELPNLYWEGRDIDFIIMPTWAIIKHLHEKGLTKQSKRPDLDKMHFILTEFNYVRINDYVYGHLVTTQNIDGLPDW